MATEAEKKAQLESYLRAARSGALHFNQRAFCSDGTEDDFFTKERAKNAAAPTAGEFCLGLLKQAADVEFNPELKAKGDDKDRDMLSFWRAIFSDKYGKLDPEQKKVLGTSALTVSDAVGQSTLDIYNKVANHPNMVNAGKATLRTKDSIADGTTVYVGYDSAPKDKYAFTPGNIFDAAFSQVILDAAAKKPIPERKTNLSPQQLQEVTDRCFENEAKAAASGIKLASCRDAGHDQAVQHAATKRALAR